MSKVQKISRTCPFCGDNYELVMSNDEMRGMREWQSGALIQDALGFMSHSKRECLKTGMCLRCQDVIFGGDGYENI